MLAGAGSMPTSAVAADMLDIIPQAVPTSATGTAHTGNEATGHLDMT